MTIATREAVLAAVARALKLDPCPDAAARAVAQALCLPVECVLEVLEAA